MNLKFIQPENNIGKTKITVHKSGKLGLSTQATKSLMVDIHKFLKFGIDKNNKIFIMALEYDDGDCFRIAKAGQYYYIKKDENLLSALGVKKSDSVCFDFGKATNGYTELIRRNF